jgi:hypothetical protein
MMTLDAVVIAHVTKLHPLRRGRPSR